MEWVFLGFALATIVYTLIIIRDFVSDSRIQNSLLEHLTDEREELGSKVAEQNEETSKINEEIKQGKEAVKELQAVIKQQQLKIKKFEESMEKKGKFRVE
jgi:peptidoglycan hydrolase CwlO-like protein